VNNYTTPSWDKKAEFMTTLFVSWAEISEVFGVSEDWDLLSKNEAPTTDVIEAAFVEAQQLKDKYTEICEQEIIEAENEIIKSIIHHWSPQNIISKHVDIIKLIELLNTWCHSGPKNPKLFPVEPPRGLGLEYFLTPNGISFSVYAPFMIPYTEVYYEEYDDLPEWNLENIISTDISEILYFLYIKQNGEFEIDLSDWDLKRKNQDVLTSTSFEI
jgi:hypothetical protein